MREGFERAVLVKIGHEVNSMWREVVGSRNMYPHFACLYKYGPLSGNCLFLYCKARHYWISVSIIVYIINLFLLCKLSK